MPTYLTTIILGLVEGLTEFIPVSSTGHLIVTDHLLGFNQAIGPERAELFTVVIQLGAILAVGFLYRAQLFGSLFARSVASEAGRLRNNLIIAFLPAAIIGWLKTSQVPAKTKASSPRLKPMFEIGSGLWLAASRVPALAE